MSSAASFRTEKDLLGVLEVPAQAYYGIQTLRAVNNFRLSGVPISHYPKLVVGLAMVKQAAADANRELGHLSDAKHAAISEACARLIRGDFHEEFVVDMFQGGAGQSGLDAARGAASASAGASRLRPVHQKWYLTSRLAVS